MHGSFKISWKSRIGYLHSAPSSTPEKTKSSPLLTFKGRSLFTGTLLNNRRRQALKRLAESPTCFSNRGHEKQERGQQAVCRLESFSRNPTKGSSRSAQRTGGKTTPQKMGAAVEHQWPLDKDRPLAPAPPLVRVGRGRQQQRVVVQVLVRGRA